MTHLEIFLLCTVKELRNYFFFASQHLYCYTYMGSGSAYRLQLIQHFKNDISTPKQMRNGTLCENPPAQISPPQ